MHEDIDLTNHGREPVGFHLEIAVRCDFADIFEVKSGSIVRRGRITTDWSPAISSAQTYRNEIFPAPWISSAQSPTKAVYANGRLSFEIAMEPASTGTAVCSTRRPMASSICARRLIASSSIEKSPVPKAWLRGWQNVVKIRTSNEEIYRLFRQAVEDMAALRLPIAGHRSHGLRACRWRALVCRTVRSRQPDRLASE